MSASGPSFASAFFLLLASSKPHEASLERLWSEELVCTALQSCGASSTVLPAMIVFSAVSSLSTDAPPRSSPE